MEEEEEEDAREKTDHADGTVAIGEENPDSGLAITLYRGVASQSVEVLITRRQQVERIGRTITSVPGTLVILSTPCVMFPIIHTRSNHPVNAPCQYKQPLPLPP